MVRLRSENNRIIRYYNDRLSQDWEEMREQRPLLVVENKNNAIGTITVAVTATTTPDTIIIATAPVITTAITKLTIASLPLYYHNNSK